MGCLLALATQVNLLERPRTRPAIKAYFTGSTGKSARAPHSLHAPRTVSRLAHPTSQVPTKPRLRYTRTAADDNWFVIADTATKNIASSSSVVFSSPSRTSSVQERSMHREYVRDVNLGEVHQLCVKTCSRAGINNLRRIFMAANNTSVTFTTASGLNAALNSLPAALLRLPLIADHHAASLQSTTQNRHFLYTKGAQHPPCRGAEKRLPSS